MKSSTRNKEMSSPEQMMELYVAKLSLAVMYGTVLFVFLQVAVFVVIGLSVMLPMELGSIDKEQADLLSKLLLGISEVILLVLIGKIVKGKYQKSLIEANDENGPEGGEETERELKEPEVFTAWLTESRMAGAFLFCAVSVLIRGWLIDFETAAFAIALCVALGFIIVFLVIYSYVRLLVAQEIRAFPILSLIVVSYAFWSQYSRISF